VFLVLSAIVALGSIAWGWVRWRGQAPERSAWASVSDDLEMQSAKIDSLKRVLADMEGRVSVSKREISSAGERLGHWGRQAVDGKLPAAEHRLYLREIDRHNEAVAKHNAEIAGLDRVHAEYTALVETHNALVDSANELQQRAVQEGIQLTAPNN
jgi:hypothetical protein